MIGKASELGASAWEALRGLAVAKYAGHTPAISTEQALELARHGLALRIAGMIAITARGEAALAETLRFLAGRYRTRRDTGVEYTYRVEWDIAARNVLRWSAAVSRDGEPAGTPSGEFRGQPADVPAAVRDFVESAIEKRAGVD